MTKQATPDMIERVARAMQATPSGRGMPDDEAREYARAAIEAMRRAPRDVLTAFVDDAVSVQDAAVRWEAAIDAALATQNTEER